MLFSYHVKNFCCPYVEVLALAFLEFSATIISPRDIGIFIKRNVRKKISKWLYVLGLLPDPFQFPSGQEDTLAKNNNINSNHYFQNVLAQKNCCSNCFVHSCPISLQSVASAFTVILKTFPNYSISTSIRTNNYFLNFSMSM